SERDDLKYEGTGSISQHACDGTSDCEGGLELKEASIGRTFSPVLSTTREETLRDQTDLSPTRPDLATLDTQGRKTNDGEEDERAKKREQRDISNA
ncbi:LanC-like protein 3, partial [Dissostichus eleginoides]